MKTAMKQRPMRFAAVALLGLTLLPGFTGEAMAQASGNFTRYEEILKRQHPETHDLLVRLERIHGVLFGELFKEGEAVRASADTMPTPDFEVNMLERLGALAAEEGTLDEVAAEATAGYALVGQRSAEINTWTNQFRRAVYGILSDPQLTTFTARRAAVAEAVAIYQSRPELALPAQPKNMDVLYDHAQALDFRTGYTDLDGLIWAGHWAALAATKPLVDLTGSARTAGLDTVQVRYLAKLSYGEPPQYFPSELPLAPAIAPELSFLSPETVAIWDNLTMMNEVMADILASPDVQDPSAALDAALTFFLDSEGGVIDPVEFGTMALRHGIFFQGGYPLAVSTKSELNSGGHAAHLRGGSGLVMPGM